jgi:hypothetical protein
MTSVVRRYSKTPKEVRYDDAIVELAEQYCQQNEMTFSKLARIALQSFLTKKIRRDDEW